MMRKGLYEIFVTFIFVIVLLIVLFLALLVNGNIALLKSQTGESRLRTSLAREAYLAFTRCNQQQIVDENRIEECRGTGQYVKAAMIRQPERFGCAEKTWGDVDFALATKDTKTDVFPFWISIRQADGGQICLAQMLIAIGGSS